MNPRVAAYETLLLCEKEKQFSNIAVNNGIKKYSLDGVERDFYTRLVYGVVEKQLTLDYLVQHYTKKSIKRLDRSVAVILRLSLYQIKFLDKIPDSAAVSEGVKLASRFASRAKGFINAVLRKACVENIAYPNADDKAEFYSVLYSVNPDICRLLIDQYGDEAETILDGYQSNPNLSLQVNSIHHSPDSFLAAYPINADRVSSLPFALRLKEKLPVSAMPFLSGSEAFVQDVASQLCTCVLSPEHNSIVIDVCACPGGKSFSAANLMHSDSVKASEKVTGHIYSFDLHASKLSLIQSGASRLGYSWITSDVQDATVGRADLVGVADRIICDVPCSGLGVIAKKPEIRYKDISEIEALPNLQYRILCTSAKYLKDDGILVYSTCTVNKKENEAVVSKFLDQHPDYRAIDFTVGEYSSQNGCLTLLPNSEHDGFFIAKIQKK